MVQCERRKNTKQYQGHAAAQKSAAWPAERHNTSGAYPVRRARVLRLAFMYFVPRRLSCGTAEETGVPRRRPRRLPRSDNVCPGRRTAPPAKNAARRAGTQNFMCKIPVCHASLFRRCRRVCRMVSAARNPGRGSIRRIFRCRPLRHIAENGLSPILVTLRGGGQAHGEAALPAPLLQKGPALHSCMEYQTSRCCKAGAPRLSAFSSALPESGRSTGR